MNEQDANKLMEEYFELQKQSNNLETSMELLKTQLQQFVLQQPEKIFKSTLGEARLITQHREKFDTKLAKTYLSPAQIANCITQSDVSFVTIMSQESLDSRKKFLRRGSNDVQK